MNPIVRVWQSGQFTETQIVQALNISHLQFRQALREADLELPKDIPETMSREILYELSANVNLNYEDASWLMDNYGISQATAYRYKQSRSSGRSKVPKHELSNQIGAMLAKGLTQEEIAGELGISQASVSLANPSRKSKNRGKPLPDKDWEGLKASMDQYTISELARMYKVSRPYIYARLKRENA